MLQRLCRLAIGAALIAAGMLSWSGSVPEARAQHPVQQPVVDKFVFDDTVQPVSAGELKRAIDQAGKDGARALLVEMDTPGGLVDSMREMVQAILASKAPVIVFVAPSGARAAGG